MFTVIPNSLRSTLPRSSTGHSAFSLITDQRTAQSESEKITKPLDPKNMRPVLKPADGNTYRPDIDGLRAIAVMAVVLYHVGFEHIRGGFLGVDVFFVISGYLISRLLIDQLNSQGKIDLYEFYLRRSRRVLPALIVTICITAIVAAWAFTPQRLETFGGSLLHAIFSVSNAFFYKEAGYFDIDSELKPLLHTWSLGIEGQFYLLWPFLLLVAGSKTRQQLLLIAFLGLISLYSAFAGYRVNPSAVFFLLPFRFFEFAMGAALVTIEQHRPKRFEYADDLFFPGWTCTHGLLHILLRKDSAFPTACHDISVPRRISMHLFWQ